MAKTPRSKISVKVHTRRLLDRAILRTYSIFGKRPSQDETVIIMLRLYSQWLDEQEASAKT